jgi:hypothetical protein
MTVCTTVYSATARTSEFSSFSFFNDKDDALRRRRSKTKHHHHIQQKHSRTDERKEEEETIDDCDDFENDRGGKRETKELLFADDDEEEERRWLVLRVGGKVSFNDEKRRRFLGRSEELLRLREYERTMFTETTTVDRSSPNDFLDGCTHEQHFRGEGVCGFLFSRGCAEGVRGETSLGVRTSLKIHRV